MKRIIIWVTALCWLAGLSQADDDALLPVLASQTKSAQGLLIKYQTKPPGLAGPLAKLNIGSQPLASGSSLQNQAKQLQQDSNIAWVEPNHWRFAQTANVTPNDIYYRPERNSRNYQQWYLFMINANYAWSIARGSDELVVAVIDTGINLNHPDLKDRLLPGISIVNQENYTPPAGGMDDNGHGTHVAGLIAASANNETGISGCSWQGNLLPVKVLSDQGEGTDADISAGIIWAADQGAAIINLSLGGSSESGQPPQALQDAVSYAHSQGALVVAASGNSGDDSIFYPASLDHVLAVAATNPWDERAVYSTYNSHVDLAAPGGAGGKRFDRGTGMISTYWSVNSAALDIMGGPEAGDYAVTAGTSMAAAVVSGAAMLLWSHQPALTADQIEMQLKSTAVDIGPSGADPETGSGRIDCLAALEQPEPKLLKLALYNYPNPFDPEQGATHLVFLLDQPVATTISIYDQARTVVWQKKLSADQTLAGKNYLSWDGRNGYGDVVGNGSYPVHVRTADGQASEIKFIAVIR